MIISLGYRIKSDIVVFSQTDCVNFHKKKTVWLSQQQIAELFQKAKSTISFHIANVFKEKELDEKVVVRKIRTTTQHGAMAGKTQEKDVALYNLDVIISVGYRVKSILYLCR